MKLLAFSILLILNITLSAQTGSLSGKISDKNGALPAVNVFILNTNLGAGADGNGNYKITGIPAGKKIDALTFLKAFQKSVVKCNPDTGCGLCENICIMESEKKKLEKKSLPSPSTKAFLHSKINWERMSILGLGIEFIQ